MRFLFVAGINNLGWYYQQWKKEIAEIFPEDELIMIDEYYLHFQYDQLEDLISRGVTLLNDGKPTFILSHSFGGLLAKTMILRAKKARILHLVTMGTPHTMKMMGVSEAKKRIGCPLSVDAPTTTFGGYIDPIVPFPLSKIKMRDHFNLPCEHLGFLLAKPIRKKIWEYLVPRLTAPKIAQRIAEVNPNGFFTKEIKNTAR